MQELTIDHVFIASWQTYRLMHVFRFHFFDMIMTLLDSFNFTLKPCFRVLGVSPSQKSDQSRFSDDSGNPNIYIEFKILLLTFKCIQGCAPLYLRELLVK